MENHREDREITRLYEASVKGVVTILDTLIGEDPLILQKLSLTSFTETPLHASALGGHLEFTEALLFHHPPLATHLDSKGRSALHLASAVGHKEIVQALLYKYDGACLLHDQSGRIPLHYAAMRGRVEVLKELVIAKPDSIQRVVNGTRQTVLHLCVKHSQLECLKLLVEEVGVNSNFINSKDSDGRNGGKTILQLALTLNQIETVRYLLSLPVINPEANDVTTLLYVLDQHIPGGSRSLQLQQKLGDASDIRRSEINNDHHHQPISPPPSSITTTCGRNIAVVYEKGEKPRWWIKRLMKYLKHPKDWLEETRGMLMVVATMMSTMTFQAAINPPGGVWQENNTNTTTGYDNDREEICSETQMCYAGEAVLGYILKDEFLKFINFNTIAFLASLSVTLLLVSGFPLYNRVCIWLLSMSMCVTLTFMALTYLQVLILVSPDNEIFTKTISLFHSCFWTWISLLVVVGAIHSIRLFIWLLKRLRSSWLKQKMPRSLRNMVSSSSNFAPTAPPGNEKINAPAVV